MQEMFEKLLNEANESYRYEVPLHISVDGLEDGEEINAPDKVELKYDIEIEFRSWGIKDIEVSLRDTVEFEVDVLDVDDTVVTTIPIKIDFSEVDYSFSWMAGAGYAAESLEVRIDREGKLLEVDANFYYVTKE